MAQPTTPQRSTDVMHPAGCIGIFDAGIGGLPLASLIRKRAPQHRIVYLGDAARRPYGPRPAAEVTRYVEEAERFFIAQGCDAWVIACNTASVVAGDALQRTIPVIDMLRAIEAAVRDAPAGPVGVLATAGTVASGVIPRTLAAREVHQLATEELLRLAEEGITDHRVDPLIDEAVAFLRERRCTTAVLACTDFTCVLDQLRSAVGNSDERDIVLLDPLEAAVELAVQQLEALPSHPRQHDGDRLCLTGRHPVDVVQYAGDTYGLDLGPVTYVTLS